MSEPEVKEANERIPRFLSWKPDPDLQKTVATWILWFEIIFVAAFVAIWIWGIIDQGRWISSSPVVIVSVVAFHYLLGHKVSARISWRIPVYHVTREQVLEYSAWVDAQKTENEQIQEILPSLPWFANFWDVASQWPDDPDQISPIEDPGLPSIGDSDPGPGQDLQLLDAELIPAEPLPDLACGHPVQGLKMINGILACEKCLVIKRGQS